MTVEGNTMAEQTLEAILAGEAPEETAEVEETEVEETEVTETEQAEADEAEADTSTAGEPKEEEKPKEPWTKAAYMSEKKKRQELERKLKEVEKQPLPDVVEDPEAFQSALRDEVSATVSAMKIGLAQDLMREIHADYDEREAQFLELAEENPSLITQLQESANPARFAYETAQKHEELQRMENLDEYKAELRKEVEAELRKEILGEKESKEAKAAEKESALKPSLADAGETGVDSEIEQSLEDIIGMDANHRKR